MRKLLYLLLFFALLVVASVAIFRAQTCVSMQPQIPQVPAATIDSPAHAQRLSEALQIATTYTEKGERTERNFLRWRDWLKQAFPLTHSRCQVADWRDGTTRLYKWAGTDEDAPALLLHAAYDLREPDLESLTQWRYNPFVGKIDSGYIWGAGSLQRKTAAVAILCAWEELLKSNFSPRRTVYLLLVGDETQLNSPSVREIAAAFLQYKTPFLHILAAGSQIHAAPFADIANDVALVSVSHAHRLGVRLTAPNSQSLNQALQTLKNWQPHWDSHTRANDVFLQHAAAELPFWRRLTATNRSLLGWQLQQWIQQQPRLLQALQPHWLAIDIGSNDNSLHADVHLHLPPHCPPQQTLQTWKTLLADNSNLHIDPIYQHAAISTSQEKSASFQLLQTTLKQLHPNIITLPAGSENAASATYFQYQQTPVMQFMPLRLSSEDYQRQRSQIDERISIEALNSMIQFYIQYIKNANI